jgi:hypothetical protein
MKMVDCEWAAQARTRGGGSSAGLLLLLLRRRRRRRPLLLLLQRLLRAPVVLPQNERVLFHYNGHGVPRPTVNGEIWVFNSR